MPIDSNIAMGVKPLQIENPMNALAQMMQIKQAQQQNQMGAIQMQDRERAIEDNNNLRKLMGGFGSDHAANQQQLLRAGRLKEANDYSKNQADVEKLAADSQKIKLGNIKEKLGIVGSAYKGIFDNPTLEQANRTFDYLGQSGVFTPEEVAQHKKDAAADPANIKNMAGVAFQSSVEAEKQLPKLDNYNGGGYQGFTSTDPITGKVTVTSQQPITESANNVANNARIAKEGALNRGNSMSIARMADDRSRDANSIKLGEKKATEDLTKGGQLASFDTMIGTLDRLSQHPGLTKTVGLRSVLPTIPGGDSANFQAELNTFQSQAFIPMVSQLKGMGALSDAEGKKLTQAVGALDPKMGEKAFRDSIDRIKKDMDSAYARVAGKPRQPNTPPTNDATNIDALLEKYK